ncbi:hypothetical protein L228DRAFT_43435 [Xylona heveae TC161]|uniref:Uncharacterized protein n=1 Tax=Xylona heveae (strain CBS 132557 / TC161) TaxID=1328760 RepID=A0A164ZRU4_XYLHT|nr:hypothetical protein L228DRAFT_43435 [Xylona heveae TC161]KZF19432.1 hypothetical protein L228DRAFT_43435 [Xylona heveae TC161]
MIPALDTIITSMIRSNDPMIYGLRSLLRYFATSLLHYLITTFSILNPQSSILRVPEQRVMQYFTRREMAFVIWTDGNFSFHTYPHKHTYSLTLIICHCFIIVNLPDAAAAADDDKTMPKQKQVQVQIQTKPYSRHDGYQDSRPKRLAFPRLQTCIDDTDTEPHKTDQEE